MNNVLQLKRNNRIVRNTKALDYTYNIMIWNCKDGVDSVWKFWRQFHTMSTSLLYSTLRSNESKPVQPNRSSAHRINACQRRYLQWTKTIFLAVSTDFNCAYIINIKLRICCRLSFMGSNVDDSQIQCLPRSICIEATCMSLTSC